MSRAYIQQMKNNVVEKESQLMGNSRTPRTNVSVACYIHQLLSPQSAVHYLLCRVVVHRFLSSSLSSVKTFLVLVFIAVGCVLTIAVGIAIGVGVGWVMVSFAFVRKKD